MARRTNVEIHREMARVERTMREKESGEPINETQIGVERLYGAKVALAWALGEDVKSPSRWVRENN